MRIKENGERLEDFYLNRKARGKRLAGHAIEQQVQK